MDDERQALTTSSPSPERLHSVLKSHSGSKDVSTKNIKMDETDEEGPSANTGKRSVSFSVDMPVVHDDIIDPLKPLSMQQRPQFKRVFTLVPERLAKDSKNYANRRIVLCERLLRILSLVLIAFTFPLSLFICLKAIQQYERAVVFRLGRLLHSTAQGPGLLFLIPCMDSVRCVDLRTFTFDVPTQEVLTKDSVTVAVDAVVYYRIFDPVMSVVNVEEASRSTRLLAQTTLRNVLGTIDLYQLLTAREEIAALMQECLDAATDTWGVKVERVEIKDVRLPTQLQRAMAAEAEAAREARAKVIAAEGERRASKALKAAAIEISECPIAIQLRYLQTLNSISAEKNSTIIFPIPIDLLSQFQKHCTAAQSHKRPSPPRSSESDEDKTKKEETSEQSDDAPDYGNCEFGSSDELQL